MGKIGEATEDTLQGLNNAIRSRVYAARTLESAAQGTTERIYDAFGDSLALVRLYITLPFGTLPPPERLSVYNLARSKGVAGPLDDRTPILSLLGTSGDEPAWNNRRESQGHRGIPLISHDFVESIPMVARLLAELGIPAAWLDGSTPEGLTEVPSRLAGLFYVADARQATDRQGRKIISAQSFVEAYGICTVFGAGSRYVLSPSFITLILFSRDSLPRAALEPFRTLPMILTDNTGALLNSGRIYAR